jgi:hypothetical protein
MSICISQTGNFNKTMTEEKPERREREREKGGGGVCLLEVFKSLDWEAIYETMAKPAMVFDGRGILDADKLRAIGFSIADVQTLTCSLTAGAAQAEEEFVSVRPGRLGKADESGKRTRGSRSTTPRCPRSRSSST